MAADEASVETGRSSMRGRLGAWAAGIGSYVLAGWVVDRMGVGESVWFVLAVSAMVLVGLPIMWWWRSRPRQRKASPEPQPPADNGYPVIDR